MTTPEPQPTHLRLRLLAAAGALAAFGIGGGLTVDEFALWVRLEDVYWAEEGRIVRPPERSGPRTVTHR